MPQKPAPQDPLVPPKNSIMEMWHKPITAFAAMLTIAVTCFGLGWKANALQQVNTLPPSTQRIRLVSELPVPASGPGRQDVILAVQPPPSPGETVQVWLNQGDHRWYRCPAGPDNNGNWKAACTFGNPASGKDTDKAHHGDAFSYGVFCSKALCLTGSLTMPVMRISEESVDLHGKVRC